MIDFFIGATTALAFLIAGMGLGTFDPDENSGFFELGMVCAGFLGLWALTL